MEILVTLPLSEEQKALLQSAAPGHSLCFVPAGQLSEAQLQNARVILGNLAQPQQLRWCGRLQWLQLQNAGTDGYCAPGLLPAGAVLTNATGCYGPAIAEHMLAAVLALYKRLPAYGKAQGQRAWQDFGPVGMVRGSTVLVVGFGDIGRAFGQSMHALGATVVGVRRRGGAVPPWAAGVYGPDQLDRLLPAADIVALCLPGGEATRHTLSARRIGLLNPRAVVVNVGRGSAVDTDALCRALYAGRIGGAALDVTDPEPLGPEHPLWAAPNTIITPHVAGKCRQPEILQRIVQLWAENLGRFLAGRPLLCQVDLETGYVR